MLAGSHGPQHLDERIDAFLADFSGTLAAMPAEEFEQHRAVVIQARQQKDCSVADEAERFWEQISSRRCCSEQEASCTVLPMMGHASVEPPVQ